MPTNIKMYRIFICIIINIAAFSVYSLAPMVPILGIVFSSLLFLLTLDLLNMNHQYRNWFEELGNKSMASLYIIALIVNVLKHLDPFTLIYYSCATMAYGYESIVYQKITKLKTLSPAVV